MPASNGNADESQQPLLSSFSQNIKSSRQGYGSTRKISSGNDLTGNEYLLKDTLYPEDAWEGTRYWADLPSDQQVTWTNQQYRSEARKDIKEIWQMFKQNPVNPLAAYMRNYAIGGVGFFAEGNVLFSVGNVMPLLKAVWPQCWMDNVVCDVQVIRSIKYLEIAGIILGQISVGYIGDTIGRRWGLIQDAAIMLTGTVLLASM